MQPIAADPCRRKHGGNEQSEIAWEKIQPVLQRCQAEVFACIDRSLGKGCTAKEAAARMGKPLNTISGRFVELHRAGFIRRTGERRDGSAVWRVQREETR